MCHFTICNFIAATTTKHFCYLKIQLHLFTQAQFASMNIVQIEGISYPHKTSIHTQAYKFAQHFAPHYFLCLLLNALD